MTETARVIRIEGSTATLSCAEHQGCDKCGSAFCNIKARTYRASLPDDIVVEEGDQVDVFVPPASAIAAGFRVLILPLILFVAAYLALSATGSEPLRVAGGIAGLALGFGFVAIQTRHRPPDLPRIVRIHSADVGSASVRS